MGGCAAGIVLLKDNRYAVCMSIFSLLLTSGVLIFVSWAIVFPIAITILWGIFVMRKRRDNSCSENKN